MDLGFVSRDKRNCLVAILLGMCASAPMAILAGMRVWENASGTQQVIAEFSELRDGQVYLRKVGGKVLKAPLDELSAEDSRYLAGVEELSARFNIPADGRLLRYNHEARANANYSIRRSLAQRVQADFRIETRAPGFSAEEWVVYAARPPGFDGQEVRSELLPDADSMWEARDGTRLLWCARIPATNPELENRFTAGMRIEADLYSRYLADAAGSANIVEPLPEAHFELYTSMTSLIDFRSPEFSNWIEKAGLNRRRHEGQVEFARRVYQTIRNGFSYACSEKMDRRASSVCHLKTSDCGGLSVLFVSVLRKNEIPARLLAGRWAKPAKPELVDFLQEHVKSEFFAAGVGWVPVDISLGIRLRDDETLGEEGKGLGRKSCFGNDKGDFITFHFDHGLEVETIHFGVETVDWLQGIRYWVSGSGNLDGTESEKSWTVTLPEN